MPSCCLLGPALCLPPDSNALLHLCHHWDAGTYHTNTTIAEDTLSIYLPKYDKKSHINLYFISLPLPIQRCLATWRSSPTLSTTGTTTFRLSWGDCWSSFGESHLLSFLISPSVSSFVSSNINNTLAFYKYHLVRCCMSSHLNGVAGH